MASPIGTALIPTQGSCLPLTEIEVFFPNLSIVFLNMNLEIDLCLLQLYLILFSFFLLKILLILSFVSKDIFFDVF